MWKEFPRETGNKMTLHKQEWRSIVLSPFHTFPVFFPINTPPCRERNGTKVAFLPFGKRECFLHNVGNAIVVPFNKNSRLEKDYIHSGSYNYQGKCKCETRCRKNER